MDFGGLFFQKHTVDAVSQFDICFKGFDVDITGFCFNGFEQDQVDQLDHRGIARPKLRTQIDIGIVRFTLGNRLNSVLSLISGFLNDGIHHLVGILEIIQFFANGGSRGNQGNDFEFCELADVIQCQNIQWIRHRKKQTVP